MPAEKISLSYIFPAGKAGGCGAILRDLLGGVDRFIIRQVVNNDFKLW